MSSIDACRELQDEPFLEVKVDDYFATAAKIPAEVKARMKYSHQENELISWDDLRYLRITHIDFKGQVKLGEMVLHKMVAMEAMLIFQRIFAAKFPIYQMVLIDDFGYEGITLSELDKRSMEANNSSAYCFRRVTGDPTRLSEHAGYAIDLNTLQNPYENGGVVLPEGGRAYLDRDPSVQGLITQNSAVYQAFKEFEWDWGGDWPDLQDFQHFQMRERAKILADLAKKKAS